MVLPIHVYYHAGTNSTRTPPGNKVMNRVFHRIRAVPVFPEGVTVQYVNLTTTVPLAPEDVTHPAITAVRLSRFHTEGGEPVPHVVPGDDQWLMNWPLDNGVMAGVSVQLEAGSDRAYFQNLESQFELGDVETLFPEVSIRVGACECAISGFEVDGGLVHANCSLGVRYL